ncbi:MAG: hypothetical protein K0R55_3275 [Sporomusa sp.]|jgi:hypothetical protein|nr:hypothetical protein [Sporomusa sp.]
MPARLVQVTLRNRSSFPLRWITDGHEYGTWQDPWLPSNLKDLQPGKDGTWRSESDTFMQGTKAWADFLVDIPPDAMSGSAARRSTSGGRGHTTGISGLTQRRRGRT